MAMPVPTKEVVARMWRGILSMIERQYNTARALVKMVVLVALLKSEKTLKTPRGVVMRWKKMLVWSEWYLRNDTDRSFQRASGLKDDAMVAAITPVHSTVAATTAKRPCFAIVALRGQIHRGSEAARDCPSLHSS